MHSWTIADRAPKPLLALLAGTALAFASVGASVGEVRAQGDDPVSGEDLRQELETRDAVIIRLQQRLDALQRQLEQEGIVTPEPDPEAPVEPVVAPPRGMLDVDELAAERALERTLVDVGAVLLRTGQAELSPSFQFSRSSGDFPFIANGTAVVSRAERNRFAFGLGLNLGLPFDSQFELDVPFDVVHEQRKFAVGGGAAGSRGETGRALGDISIGVAKTLLREDGGWQPDLVGRFTWDAATGQRSDGDVFLGGGFNTLRGQLVAIKRQDPIAFVGAVGYAYTFEDGDLQPGQQFNLSLGATLALSPETSLTASLNQTYIDEFKRDGSSVDGSDQLAASFSFGGSAIIAPRTLLRLTSSIGLTDDAADYAVRASVAYRFSTPFF